MDPTPEESLAPSPLPPPQGGAAGHSDPYESVYRANLEAFGGRAARLCTLLQRGRLTADACFLALTQLWIQLARSHRRLRDTPERPDRNQGETGGGEREV